MRGFQRLQVVGNLGKDPELRYTPQGQSVCSFPVAVNRKWSDSSGNSHEETLWVRVSVWGPQSEACANYLKKGHPVFAEGRLSVDKGTGGPRLYARADGTTASSFEMTGENVLFLPTRFEGETAPAETVEPKAAEADEIPF